MSDRCTLLQQINEISFVVNDLNLYLDTHPTDTSALEEFSQAMAQRRQLLDAFAKEYEPLTLNCVCPDTNNKSESHTNTPDRNILPGLTDLCPGTSKTIKEVPCHVDL